MWFNITLMHSLCCKLFIQNDVCVGETCFNVTVNLLISAGNIGRLPRWWRYAFSKKHFVQQRGFRLHRLLYINNVGQYFVLYFNCLQCLLRNVPINSSNRCQRMPFVQHFASCQQIIRQVTKIWWLIIDKSIILSDFWHIGRGHDGFDTFNSQGLRDIDAQNSCVSIRTAQHCTVQFAGQRNIRPELCPPRNLVGSIRSNGPATNQPKFFVGYCRIISAHFCSSLPT